MFVGLAKSTLLYFIIVTNLIFVFSLWCIDWVREPLCVKLFMYNLYLELHLDPGLRNGSVLTPPGSLCYRPFYGYGPSVIFSLFGFVVFTTEHFVLSCLALCFCVFFQSCLALWSPRLGKRKLVYVLLVDLFVYFAHINFCPFSLPLGVRDWL